MARSMSATWKMGDRVRNLMHTSWANKKGGPASALQTGPAEPAPYRPRSALTLHVEHDGFVPALATEIKDQTEIHDEHDHGQPRDGTQRVAPRLVIDGIEHGLLLGGRGGCLHRVDGRVRAEYAAARRRERHRHLGLLRCVVVRDAL